MTKYEEYKILQMAREIENRANEWEKEVISDKNYLFKNSEVVIHVLDGDHCEIHSREVLEKKSLRMYKARENDEHKMFMYLSEQPIFYCKYCQKLFIKRKNYDAITRNNYLLGRIAKKGIIINNFPFNGIENIENYDFSQIDCLLSINDENLGKIKKNFTDLEARKASIKIVQIDGKIITETFPVYFSKKTGCCYVYEQTIARLKLSGVLLCKLHKANCGTTVSGMDNTRFNIESLIHQYGYNVSAANDLSDEQRKMILCSVIENGVLSIEDIKNHLSFLYNLNKKDYSMRFACDKWQKDFMFLDNYKLGEKKKVKSKEFIMANRIVLS